MDALSAQPGVMGEDRCKSGAFVQLCGFVSLCTGALLIFPSQKDQSATCSRLMHAEHARNLGLSRILRVRLTNRLELLQIMRLPRPHRLELVPNFACQDRQKGQFPRVSHRACAENPELSQFLPRARSNRLELSEKSLFRSKWASRPPGNLARGPARNALIPY